MFKSANLPAAPAARNIARISLPAKAKRNEDQQIALNEKIQQAFDAKVSNLSAPDGWSIDPARSLRVFLEPTTDQINTVMSIYPDMTTGEARRYLILRDNLSSKYFEMTEAQIIKEVTARKSVRITRTGPNTINNIDIDVVQNGSNLSLAPTPAELGNYLKGVGDIESFSKTHNIPANVDLKTLKIRIMADAKEFGKEYKRHSSTKRTQKEISEYTFGVNIGTPRRDGTIGTVILLNNALLREHSNEGVKFVTRMSDTITHEFSHSIQNGISKVFNDRRLFTAYNAAYKEFITEYGATKPGEHFADSMAKYIQTGEASPTFLQFLNYVGIIT